MKQTVRESFLSRSMETLGKMYDGLEKLQSLAIGSLDSNRTALVIIDMTNGFAKEGSLSSPRVKALIPGIVEIIKICKESGIAMVALNDQHDENAAEFDGYPPHCVQGTAEAELVDEIKEQEGYVLIPKNSTNGFLEEGFQAWLKVNARIDTFILVGDCTDICIQQLALTLKAYFNMQNRHSRIIVPESAVNTYDLDVHQGDLMHVMALFNMTTNGIEVVSHIEA